MINLEKEHLTRQLDLIDPNKQFIPINIIGAGAIGSFAALQLAKCGFTNLKVWDFDTVSVENMNCQFYRFKDIGKPKVEALRDLIHDFTGAEIEIFNRRFEGSQLDGIVVVAVDSMEARKAIWDGIKKNSFLCSYVIDSRMGAEDCLMYAMNPFSEKDIATYEKTLYSDENAVQERCTAKSTIYTANLLSGLVTKTIKNMALGEQYPRVVQWSIKHNDQKAWGAL